MARGPTTWWPNRGAEGRSEHAVLGEEARDGIDVLAVEGVEDLVEVRGGDFAYGRPP
jgi:hypothetical protein